jgi:hypothetical protein
MESTCLAHLAALINNMLCCLAPCCSLQNVVLSVLNLSENQFGAPGIATLAKVTGWLPWC